MPQQTQTDRPPVKGLALIGIGLSGLGSYAVMLPRSMGRPLSASWSAIHMASRAFGLGSLLCVSTATTLVGLVSCWTGCSTLMEFGDFMRARAPDSRRRLQRLIGIQEIDKVQEPSPEEVAALEELDRIFSDAVNEKRDPAGLRGKSPPAA